MRLPFGSERVLTHVAADASRAPGLAAGTSVDLPCPTSDGRASPDQPGSLVLPGDPLRHRLEALIRVAVAGEPDEVASNLVPGATGWSPGGTYQDRAGAVALAGRSMAWLAVDELEVTTLLWSAPFVFAEWYLTARQDEPMLIRDDLLVEPTGRVVTLAGAVAIELGGERIASAHVYFDDAALIEQLLFPAR